MRQDRRSNCSGNGFYLRCLRPDVFHREGTGSEGGSSKPVHQVQGLAKPTSGKSYSSRTVAYGGLLVHRSCGIESSRPSARRMARWGEGDPRWLVQHREDGTNINGWHWEEKNMMSWSREKLEAMFEEDPVTTSSKEGTARLHRVKEVKGEASLTRRKGNKKFAFYDLKITLEWDAKDSDTGEDIKGTCTVSEFATGHDDEEVEFEIKPEGKGGAHDRAKKAVSQARAAVYAKLKSFVEELEKQ